MNSTLFAAQPIRLTPSKLGCTTSGSGPPGRKLVVTRSCSARLSVRGVTDLRRAAHASRFDAIDVSATPIFHRSFQFELFNHRLHGFFYGILKHPRADLFE